MNIDRLLWEYQLSFLWEACTGVCWDMWYRCVRLWTILQGYPQDGRTIQPHQPRVITNLPSMLHRVVESIFSFACLSHLSSAQQNVIVLTVSLKSNDAIGPLCSWAQLLSAWLPWPGAWWEFSSGECFHQNCGGPQLWVLFHLEVREFELMLLFQNRCGYKQDVLT